MANDYVNSIISKHQLSYIDSNIIEQTANGIYSLISSWAYPHLLEVKYSGSVAKGTGVKGSSDIDLFISISSNRQEPLAQIHSSLVSFLTRKYIPAKAQNVSIGVTYNGLSIDLTPGKKYPGNTNDHSIYSHRRKTWQQTNIDQHVSYVGNSGRINEIKLAKIWRNLHNLDFPSFYLELTVIDALSGHRTTDLADNFADVLAYLRDSFINARVIDPANSRNIVSDDLTSLEKARIARAAQDALTKKWGEVIW